MTAPFAPTLTSPKNRGASPSASVTMTWKFNTSVAGDAMATFAIRRRQMAPSVGSYEYWTGSAWGAETFIAPGSTVNDGASFSYAIGTGWTAGNVYQWSVKVRNSVPEASSYAVDNLIQIHARPSLTMPVVNTSVSRPVISWTFVGASGFYQKSYRLYVSSIALSGDIPGQIAANYGKVWDSGTVYSSSDYKVIPDLDLVTGTTYWLYYFAVDGSDLDSLWSLAYTWTSSFTPITAPTLTATASPSAGTVTVVARRSLNMLPTDDAAMFITGISTWAGTLQCTAAWDSVGMRLKMTANAAGANTTAQSNSTGNLFAVVAGTSYTAVATLNGVVARACKIGIRWYNANSTASPNGTTPLSQGSAVTLVPGVDALVQIVATAPASATYAAIEITWAGSTNGDIVYADNVAMAPSSSPWSDFATAILLALDVSFVIERSKDAGVTWEALWGCSRTAPSKGDLGNIGQVTIVDRAAPLGTNDIRYRAYAVSGFYDQVGQVGPVWSALQTATISGMNVPKQYLRNTADVTKDVAVLVGQFDEDTALRGEVIEPEGRTFPIVTTSLKPKTRTVSVSLMTTDIASHEAVMASLKAEVVLCLQTNVDGQVFYLRPIDTVKRSRTLASPTQSYNAVRNLFTVSFVGAIVKDYV